MIPMLFAVHYTTRPAAGTKADTAALMQQFGERGEVAGTVAHYVYPGGGGMVIVEQDDMTVLYETVSAYGEWLDFDVRPILDIDTAVPLILAYLGS
jgi:hypothetical protein